MDWSSAEYLIIDAPPGTSDEHMSLVQYLKSVANKTLALIVSGPQKASVIDVNKEISFCEKTEI